MKSASSKVLFYIIFLSALAFPAIAAAETLEQVLATVYQNNPELAAARAKLRAADEQISTALSGWRPSLEATAEDGKSHQRVSGNGVASQSKTLTPSNIGISLTQPVFSGFRTTAEVQSAEAFIKAQQAELQDTEQKLFLDSAKAYLDVVQAQVILELTRDNENVLQKKLEEVQDRLRIKELKKTDVSQAQSRLKAVMVSRLQAEGDLANQRTTFARLVGQMPSIVEQPNLMFSLPKMQEEAVSLSLQKNPNVVAATYSADSARADIATAKGNLLPKVDIVGSATHAMNQGLTSPEQQNSAAVLVRLTMPLYKSGEDYSKTRAAQQTSAQKRLELEDARNRAREQASNAWQSLLTARDAKTGYQDVVSATAEALDGVILEAKFGTRTTLDVLNAEQELLDAKIKLAKASHDEILSMLQLKASIGELTAESLHLPITPYDPLKNYNNIRNKWAGFSEVKE